MKLLDELYKVISTRTEEQRFTLRLLPESVIYGAHFPGMPITPGVCIIQIAGELLASLLPDVPQLVSVSNAKFLAVIDPGTTPEIDYQFKKIAVDEENKSVKVTVEVKKEETIFAKLSLLYRYD